MHNVFDETTLPVLANGENTNTTGADLAIGGPGGCFPLRKGEAL